MKMRNALDTGKILHNRFILYFVLFLALADLLFLAMGSEFISVAVFILSGFVTSFFSKNMMVIMCVAMVITNILKYGTDIRMQEGLKEATADEANPEDKPTEDKPTDAKPAEVKPADAKPADAKPAEVKPAEAKTAEVKPTEAKPEVKTKPADEAKIVLTEEEKRKFTENMEKLEAYEPLFTSMDKLMGKISNLMSP
jgi:outer membrane biosynthesis protein TonB